LVYENYGLEIPSNLLEYFKNSTIFGHHWRYIATEGEEGIRFRVRDEKIQHVDVIPECIYDKEGEEALNVRNLAKIPLSHLIKNQKKESGVFYPAKDKKGKTYWICCYPYSYELGFDYSAEVNNIEIL